MSRISYRPGVDTNLRVVRDGQQIGLIVDIQGRWMLLAEPFYYEADTLREIAEKLGELNAKEAKP
jgi:hypothetical protein